VSGRSRRWFWAGVAASLMITAAGAAIAATGLVLAARPDAPVRDYLADVRSGDAAAALALGSVPTGDRRFLTAAVLADQSAAGRIEDLQIASIQRQGESAVVSIRYQLVGPSTRTAVQDDIPVRKHGLRWRLAASAVLVTPSDSQAASRIAVAGASVPTQPYLMFPGALPAQTNSALLSVDRARAVIRFATDVPQYVPLVIPDEGRAAISAALDAAMVACLGDQGTDACGLSVRGVRYVPGSLAGTVSALPSAGPPVLTIGTEPGGVILVTGTFGLAATWRQLDFNNIEQDESGPLTLTYSAKLSADTPVAIQWGYIT
jgi:hypothetical protein